MVCLLFLFSSHFKISNAYMCFVSPVKRTAQSTVLSKTRSKFQLLIKIKIILKIFIFKYINKSYLIIYGLENIFKEK